MGVDAEERRRRREEFSKNKREETLFKKRQVVPSSQPPLSNGAPPVQTSKIKFQSLPCMVAGIYSNDSKMQLEATTQFRKLLSSTGSPPIEDVIQYGVVPLFSEFLMRNDFPQLKFEAAWALINIGIAISDHVAVPFIVKLLASQSVHDLREQVMNDKAKILMLRNATWTISNFCRGKPHPLFELRKPAVLAALELLLVLSNDEEVLTNTCWALSYLYADDKIQAVIEPGVCQCLVELLQHPSPSVLIPALRTVGNIVTGDDDVQIQVLIKAGLITPLMNLLQTAEFDIKKEAACVISNATSGRNIEEIKYLVKQGCIKPLCDLLSCPDPRIVTVCLQGLENILKVGEVEKNLGDVNCFVQLIEDVGGWKTLLNLQGHDNDEIHQKAVKLLETYCLEEVEIDERVV